MTDPDLPAGIVLAGGASSRMGRDKSLLRLDGSTLLERAVATLSHVFEEVLVAGGREVRTANRERVRVVQDRFPCLGPLGGIHAALKETDRNAGFVAACDMPLLDPDVIAKQVALWRTVETDALVPLVNGRPEPLHAVYAKRCLPAIEEQIERGEYRVRALLNAVRVHFWEPGPAETRTFANVNTPEDWAEITSPGGGKAC